MNEEIVKNNVVRDGVRAQLLALQSMSLGELTAKWKELFNHEPPEYGIVFMRRRLAYRIQELIYGGLSSATQDRINAINTKVVRKSNCLRSGTRIVRSYHDKQYEVLVRENGYEFEGMIYGSLSAIARKICGINRNGYKFFGLENKK